MKKIILALLLLQPLLVLADSSSCSSVIIGHNIVKKSLFPFFMGDKKACFFAFYTNNPEPMKDMKGNGNLGASIWYGYYLQSKPERIYEFPKPTDLGWSNVCTLDAVSFCDINDDHLREVTIIGSCEENTYNYTFPFVFIRRGEGYILDENIYNHLYGVIGLTVSDIRNYIKNPNKYRPISDGRFNFMK